MREFAPGAALLTDTPSTEDLQAALEELICNDALKEELRQKGLKRASEITWRVTAEKTMSVLWDVANR